MDERTSDELMKSLAFAWRLSLFTVRAMMGMSRWLRSRGSGEPGDQLMRTQARADQSSGSHAAAKRVRRVRYPE